MVFHNHIFFLKHEIDIPLHNCSEIVFELSVIFVDNNEANKLIMRSIKMDITTLDKYVKQTKTIKETNIILPKSREIDIINPQLK